MATLKTRDGKTYEHIFPSHEATGVSFILEGTSPGESTRFFIPYENIAMIFSDLTT